MLIQLSYALLGKDDVYCWKVKQDGKMKSLACLFWATYGTYKCNPRWSLGLEAGHSLIEAEDRRLIEPAHGSKVNPMFPQHSGVIMGARELAHQSRGAKTTQCREKRHKLKLWARKRDGTS